MPRRSAPGHIRFDEREKIAELNSSLETFAEALRSDTMAAKRVEGAIVSFGPVQTV